VIRSFLVPTVQGKHPAMGTPHAKFTNYSFDVTEFLRLSLSLGEKVLQRKREAFSLLNKVKPLLSSRDEL